MLKSFYRPTWAEINLDAMHHNILEVKKGLKPGTRILASVKANAYGHGAIEIAKAAERFGVDYLGVAFLDEALQIRNAGVQTPILVLGFVAPKDLEIARKHDITIAFYREDQLEAAKKLTKSNSNNKLKVHIKLDTGMGRLGIIGYDESMQFIERCLDVEELNVEGLFTHYSKADETDKQYTLEQYLRFHAIEEAVRKKGYPISIIHAANSAGGIDTPQWTGDMVRLGIAMYGIYPSENVMKERVNLQPVMSLKSKIVHEKEVPEQWGVSYGAKYYGKQGERIGTIPIGYADGFSRKLTSKAHVLIRGQKVPVVGTICMDQCMVSLTSVHNSSLDSLLDEEVVLIGKQGNEEISVDEVANLLDTIPYELTCMIAHRIPRVYIQNGKEIAVTNSLI